MLLVGNPFINAYFNSDLFGKFIFILLLLASLVSWTVIIYKLQLIYSAKKSSSRFFSLFQKYRLDPLAISYQPNEKTVNPFLNLYAISKSYVLDLVSKNPSHQPLSSTDMSLVESQLATEISNQSQQLDNHLFVLATVMSLGPFLGLLGTVWGILVTFGELQNHAAANNQAILGGISLALATTVLGLLDAIPALIGYNYFKHSNRAFLTEMENFCSQLLASIDLYYRRTEVK